MRERSVRVPALAGAVLAGLCAAAAGEEPAHFDPAGKLPSAHTRAFQAAQRANLPFADERDLEEAARGFVAAPGYDRIVADSGQVVWDMGAYRFLLEAGPLDSVHPSLQRQALLNTAYGLYEVVPGRIWQVRGFDLANITFVKGDTGWIVFDTLTARETARAALAFVNETLGPRPVVAVVHSHSHADHFGGVRGVVDEADVAGGRVPVIAPAGFLRHAVAENLYAGPAMTRRLYLQYGLMLPASPYGHVDQAIGKRVALGDLGLIEPTRYIEDDFEELTIDGVRMVFQNTPGTEAPAEMNTWFPDLGAFWAAENISATVHNIYTLRGALVRDALDWSKHINVALYRFGREAEVMLSAHNWPRFGNERVQEVMRVQRDAYAHLNNAVLRLANGGVTINEIHNVYAPPPSLQAHWAARSYHGSEAHNSRAVINRYLGYWDGNPATLIPLSPADSAPLYVEMMGGAEKILAKAGELHEAGRYLESVEILNRLVYAEPGNPAAKAMLADAFEQVGYRQESASLRNSFLAAAHELRNGMPAEVPARTGGPDMVRAVTTDLWLDYLAVNLDSARADGVHVVVNLSTPDNGERYVLELSHGTLTSIEGYQSPDADATLIVDRADLERVIARTATLRELILAGDARLEGDPAALVRLFGSVSPPDPTFELVPGTRRE